MGAGQARGAIRNRKRLNGQADLPSTVKTGYRDGDSRPFPLQRVLPFVFRAQIGLDNFRVAAYLVR